MLYGQTITAGTHVLKYMMVAELFERSQPREPVLYYIGWCCADFT